jgi:hypothetical protein
VAALAGTACVDLSAPKDAPASVSLLQAGSLFVVQGDVLRDTLGNAAKLAVIAYDGEGNEISGITPSFFVIDSIPKATLSADGTLTGTALGTARVIGQIGNIQTPPTTIFVTVAPTTLVRPNPNAKDSVIAPVSGDSSAAIGSVSLQAGVRGASNALIGGAFVRFTITKTLASREGKLAAYLQDDNNHAFPLNVSTPDTTDASGNVSRKLVVNSLMLGDADLLAGKKVDTVVVEVTAKYRGVPLSGSPLRLAIPIRTSFGQP